MPENLEVDRQRSPGWLPRRWLLAAVGAIAVGLGALGVFVPGLPTTVFLLIASYCFTRSCPWLEDCLLRIPLFAPYMRFIDENRPMSAHSRTVAIGSMWTSVLLSLVWLRVTGHLPAALAAAITALATVGTLAILRFRRGLSAVSQLPGRFATTAADSQRWRLNNDSL